MSGDNQVFLSWEERVISQEKRNRVVHYYLKHFSSDWVLAVVGTERSVRHMIYVISEDLLNAYGCRRIAKPGTKWRSRREVVEWLTATVSNYRQSNSQATGSTESLKSSEFLDTGIGTQLGEQMASRKQKVQRSDIVWSGDARICSKRLKHYPAFCRNGVTICVHSFAYIMGDGETCHLAYLDDLYEDKKGQKKVRVRWFHRSLEVERLIPQLNADPGEVFITPHEQVINAECIDGVALVLTPKDYKRYMALHPQSFSSGVHMCHREFRNNKVKLFSLSKMRGYGNQPVLSYHVSQHRVINHKSNEEVEGSSHKDLGRQGAKKVRTFKGNQKLESGHCGFSSSAPENQITKCEPTHQKLKIKLSSKGAVGIKLVGPESQCPSSFMVGDNIELLCQDSGMRACWFRCKILQALQKCLKVQYCDVDDVDGSGKLEEWVPASRVADPCKLGMRHTGRLTVRPWPAADSSDYAVQIGTAVDAWWCDGWWEGIIIRNNISGSDHVQVYFPGENKLLTFDMNNTRISRDWIGDKWVEIKAKHDILSFISSTVTATMKLSMCSGSAEVSTSALVDCKIVSSPKFEASQDDKQKLLGSVSSDGMESVKGLNLENRLSIKDDEDKFPGGSDGSNSDTGGKVSQVEI